MADKETQSREDIGGAQDVGSEERQPVNLHELPEFREYQSKQDRRLAELQQQNQQMQEQMEELIDDPEAKKDFQLKRMQNQLEQYKQQERVIRQRQRMAERWNIPEGVLEGIDNPSAMTTAALDYLNEKAQDVEKTEEKKQKEEELEELERQGGHDVSTTQSTPPDEEEVNQDELDEQIDELREVARGRGTNARQARVEILKLEAQRNAVRRREARL